MLILRNRSEQGSAQISEFAVSLFFLVVAVVIPLINLCVVPLRWGLGRSIVNSRVHQLAQCETLSQAYLSDAGDSRLQASPQAASPESSQAQLLDDLNKIGGISIKSSQLSLTVESSKLQGETRVITKVGGIARDWLPDGPLGPYVYRLDLQIDGEIAPLCVVNISSPKIPGLTAPFAVQFHDTAVWENTGRDPVSGEFFVNE